MRILHVYKDFDPPVRGGMERHVALMCRYQRQWADVEALVCSRSPRTRVVERDESRVTEVGEWGRFQSAPVSPAFPWHLRRSRADIVVVHVPNPTAELGYLLAGCPGKLIVRYQSDIVRQATALRFYAPFMKRFLRKASLILASSEQYLRTSPTLQRLENRDVFRVVPLGIVPEDFEHPDEQCVADLRTRYGGSFVLFSGMHRYYKGLDYLVRAAGAIKAPVVIAGAGPERARLQALARDLNVAVAFPGTLSHEELVNHLHACSVFAFPSVARSEAYGISMLEAHACAKPVVATRLGTGVEFVNEDGKTGLNVAPRDAHALAQAVNALLDDEASRVQMGTYARERVCSEFRADHIARQEFELYQEALTC